MGDAVCEVFPCQVSVHDLMCSQTCTVAAHAGTGRESAPRQVDIAASAGAAWSACGQQPALWLLRMLELHIQQGWGCPSLCPPQHRAPHGPCAAWQSCSSWWRSARHAQLAQSVAGCCLAECLRAKGYSWEKVACHTQGASMPLRPAHAASFQGQGMQLEVNMQARCC